MCSLIIVPGIFVLIGLNSPRTLAGASGFGSQMSIWEGPPCRKIMITLFADSQPRAPACFCTIDAAFACSFQRKKCGTLMPIIPIDPMRSSSRKKAQDFCQLAHEIFPEGFLGDLTGKNYFL